MDRKEMIAALKPGVMLYMAQDSGGDVTIFRLEVMSIGKVFVSAKNPNRPGDRAERIAIWSVASSYHLSKRAALEALVDKERRNISASERSIVRSRNTIETATRMLVEEAP